MGERIDPLHPLTADNATPGTRIQHRFTKRQATIVQQSLEGGDLKVWVIFDGERRDRHRKIYAAQFLLLTPEEDTP